jgi:acyl transferase domain-containing protein/NAD(P)-dependent dehydrogenase (short-subunit alcohol dehydrogenase family)/acyl carrier protein
LPTPADERSAPGRHAVVLSAATRSQLETSAGRWRAHLAALAAAGQAPALASIAYTAQTARVPMAHRLAVTCADVAGLIEGLDAFGAGRPHPAVAARAAGTPAGELPDRPDDELDAAAAWLDGHDVAWERCWETPPARVPLPPYPFADEAHPLPMATAVETVEAGGPDRDGLERYLVALYSEVSGIPASRLDVHAPLEDHGLSSYVVVRLNSRLQADLGEERGTLFYEHPTLAAVARALAARDPRPPAAEDDRGVAIVGIAGRYPQAPDLERFWEILAGGRDCVTPLPPGRRRTGWPADLMWGAFLDDVDRFDPLLFNVTPRDAALMDPQERIFLEVVWTALEDAGYTRGRLRDQHGSKVAVYVGAMHNEYPYFGVERTLRGSPLDSGATLANVANRVSYFFDLKGPSLALDTMCSSALTAVHLAVGSLRSGECEVAIAGATNLSLHPNKFIQQRRLHLTASDHRSRAFAEGGDGFVPGEGVAAVVLKRVGRAMADGDPIHAVIRGTAVLHSGKTNGWIVPSPVMQAEVVRQALADAGVRPAAIGYLEAHGTGTALGDPIEMEGLARAFADAGLSPGSIPIGSVKSNIGHLEAAAGLAGLTKVVLQMRHRTLAPSIHARELNPGIPWDRIPFRVQRELADWPAPAGGPRRAGISSFGAGGSVSHVVLEAGVAPEPATGSGRPRLLVLSGRDEAALVALAGGLAAFLRGNAEVSLDDVAHTLQVGREPLKERLALVASDLPDARARLERFCEGRAEGVFRGTASAAAAPAEIPPDDAEKLAALGRAWAQGAHVDWAALARPEQEGGRPRVVGLPTYPFARTRCWLPDQEPEPQAEIDLLERTWAAVPDPPAGREEPRDRLVCLFADASEEVAGEVARAWGAERVVLVREGPDRGDGTPAFSGVADAAALVERLLDADPGIAGWIDLCDLHREAGAPGPWTARLSMLQRLVSRPLRVLHVTRGLLDLAGPPPSLAGARMAGFVRMLGAEHRAVVATVLDTDLPPGRAGETAEQVIAEWLAPERRSEVCRRQGRRHLPSLSPLKAPHVALALDAGRAYLVTGGTRGLGALVAGNLVRRGARRLALLGARPLPPRAEWDGAGLSKDQAAAVAEVRRLERDGARVLVHTGALTDRAALAGFLAEVRTVLGPVAGVVHCAGRVGGGSPAFARKDLAEVAAVMEPKVDGLEVLADLCAPDPLDFFVLFSSIAAAVPRLAAGLSDYAAANAFMDLMAAERGRRGHSAFRSVAWPAWRESGSAAHRAGAGAPAGLASIGDEEGIRVLERVLALPRAAAIVPCPPLQGPVDVGSLLHANLGLGAGPPVATAAAPAAAGGRRPAWLVELFTGALGLEEGDLDPAADFGELGVESVMLAELLRQIERRLGRPLEPSTLLDHPTLERLSAHLEQWLDEPAAPAVTPVHRAAPARAEPDGRVAVVGVACRFPGAPDVEAFWDGLVERRCAIAEVPRSRWDHRLLYRPAPGPGRSVSRWGGFLDGIEDFDPAYFRLGDQDAVELDPAIRLSLEAVATCLAAAGYEDEELRGRDVGVFLGARMSDYRRRAPVRSGAMRSDQNFIAAHVAHRFDLHGPNLVVDSACSSSLVSVQLACRSLLAGESELAIAGGVEVLLDERPYVDLSAAHALSPTGRCFAFDERADGLVPGEGCGVLLLKPLAAAVRDGDRVLAVIESVAVNNDGHTMGLTTPNPKAQAAVVRRALVAAGRRAGEVGLVEAHGTGTQIGDPIELRALTDVFRETADGTGWCAIGSVKPNIGHLLSAAGVAGLLKVVLAVTHGQLPPTLYSERPNPRFDLGRSPFFLNGELRPWPTERGPRVAGVSAFGLGGTNAHAIVGQPAEGAAPRRRPLPPPVFHRRRLWLDRDDGAADAAAGGLVASTLDLDLRLDPVLAGGA